MSRVKFTATNIFFGYISSIASLAMGFISRTIFIQVLNVSYLGVNGLFTNVLGVLSLAELGIGSAMNYSLYKPVANHDIETIKSLMQFYKKAYRTIALVVAVIGFAILPLLPYIVKDPGNIGNIHLYYLIFLFNTVTSYLVSYKFSLAYAEQKAYIFSNVNTITTLTITATQIIVLLIFKNFLIYLLTQSLVLLLQKVFVNLYLNKKYPYLCDKKVKKLTKEEFAPIKTNITAMIFHKLGEISVFQTDNIIISAFINVTTVGLISNYNLIITSVSGLTTIILKSAVSSLGNLIACEDVKKQYEVFKVYRFVVFWIYGFCSIAFYILLSPFIELWLGKNMLIPEYTILLILINYYLEGHRSCIVTIKSAGGIFNQDKFVALLQAGVNLVVSIILVKLIGLPGVYIGTITQGLLSTIIKPVIVYRNLFNRNASSYFWDGARYAVVVIISGAVCYAIKSVLLTQVTVINFIILIAAVALVPNLIFLLFFGKTPEFKYLWNIIHSIVIKITRKQSNA
ncbi:polysaccharide biosynthesis protein [Acetanaerobacterium elongatum]|nr:polysaccharide biosynthesis protein [Acetanaerobacterium elongatum]